MADVAQAPQIPGQTFVPPTAQPNAMEVDGAPPAVPAVAPPAPVPEVVEASETLYIQNLNEKIKIERTYFMTFLVMCVLISLIDRDEVDIAFTFQRVREDIRCCCAWQFAYEGASICII